MSQGLGIVLTGTFIQIATVLVGAVIVIALSFRGMGGIAGVNRFTVFGLGFLVLAGGILAFVGQCMCCAAPEESRVRKFAINAVICGIAAMVIGLVSTFILRAAAGQLFAGIVGFIGRLVGLAGYVFFLLFLRAVARFFGDESLGRGVNRFLVFSGFVVFGVVALFLASLGILFAALRMRAAAAGLGIILSVVAPLSILVCMIIWLIWYLRLVRGTRDVIRAAHGS